MFQCCLALLCGSSAAAQAVLSCDSRTDIVREGLPRLAAYQSGPAQLAALKKAPYRRFGPFDRATYGFTSLDIYLRSLRTSEDSMFGLIVAPMLRGVTPDTVKVRTGRWREE
jgi:hypothetical protein